MSDYEPTEDEMAALTLLGALTEGTRWGFVYGRIRSMCRCPMEVAAHLPSGMHMRAAEMLGFPEEIGARVVYAADRPNNRLRPWLLAALGLS